jgi:peptidoglycan hydrolase CwlO-like protein
MSSLIEKQNKILALEAEIVELKQKLTGFEAEMVAFKAELKAEGKSASEILVLLSEMTRILSEDKHQLNLLLEEKKDLRREQQTSAGRNINFHSHLFNLFPTRFNLFPIPFI